jgi:hypothetical protein
VLNALNERDNPPNDSEMASIHTNDTVISKKELLESKRDFYRAKKQQAVNQLVRLNMNEALLALNDSIEAAIANIYTPMSYYTQAFCRYNKADSAGVIDKLTDINSDFDLSGYETDMLDAFQEYFNLLLALQSEDKQLMEVDSTRKNILSTIMQNSGGILQAYCRNILIHTDGLIYNEPFLLPATSSNKSTKLEKPFDNFNDDRSDFIKLYPNPAKNYITLEYDLPYGPENVIVQIITITGHQVEVIKLNSLTGQKIIDLRNYRGGSYLIRAWADGKVLQSRKFTKF